MSSLNIASAQARTREWTSFHGDAVPLSGDPFETGQDFIRALHHRLCQPLTALSCTLEIMQLGHRADAKLSGQLQTAVAQSERLVEMMALFRQLFEAETPESERHATLIDRVVSEVVDDLRPLAEMQEVVITLTAEAQTSVDLKAGQLRQAVWNVLQNCVELTPAQGCVQVEICGGDLVITDTSQLTAEETSNLFDPFSFCQERSRGAKVSNLPLALTQRIVCAAGGHVTAKTSVRGGRTFHLHLPPAQLLEAGPTA